MGKEGIAGKMELQEKRELQVKWDYRKRGYYYYRVNGMMGKRNSG